MDALILTTLLFNSLGIVVTALGTALAYCLPNRHQTRTWVLPEAAAATPPRVEAVELPHAA